MKRILIFFEVNTKYISSNVLKISVISRVRSTSEIADIFNTFDENLTSFPSHFSLILLSSAHLGYWVQTIFAPRTWFIMSF